MKVLSELQEHIFEVTETDDGHEEMDCRVNKKKRSHLFSYCCCIVL